MGDRPPPTADASAGAPDVEAEGDDDRGLVRSSGVVAIGTMLSRATGLVRTTLMAIVLGTGGLSAAYNLANNTPNMIYDLLLGGVLSATLVPALVSNRERRDRASTDAVLTVATVVLVVISVLAVLLAPLIIDLYSIISEAGTDPATPEEEALATTLLRWFAPQILFYGLTTLGTAHLNAERRFAAAAFAPVLNNVWMIFLFLAAGKLIGEKSVTDVSADNGLVLLLGAGTTAGVLAMAVVLWPAIVRARARPRWRFSLRDPSVRQVARLSGWTFGYVIANQVTLFVLLGLAGLAVPVWNYAYQFFQLPYGVITVSVMTAFTPALAGLAARGDDEGFRDRFWQGLRLVLLLLLPATVLFLTLAQPMVWVLFVQWGGRFTAADAGPTVDTIVALAWGIVGFSLYLYVLRGYYAMKDTRTPFFINLAENAITLVLAFVLGSSAGFGLGVTGLAWAWSLAYLVSAVLAFSLLRRRMARLPSGRAGSEAAAIGRMVLSAAAMALVLVAVRLVLPDEGAGAWLALFGGTAVGLAVYLGFAWFLRIAEVGEVKRVLLRRG